MERIYKLVKMNIKSVYGGLYLELKLIWHQIFLFGENIYIYTHGKQVYSFNNSILEFD